MKNFFAEQFEAYERAGIVQIEINDPHNRWWLFKGLNSTNVVTCLDEFQSLTDLQQDIAGLLIKPLTCYYLSWYHSGNCLYQLALAAVHLLTLNPNMALEYFKEACRSFIGIFYFYSVVYVELVIQLLSLTSRSLVTASCGVYRGGAGFIGLFSNSKQQKEDEEVDLSEPDQLKTI